MLTGTLEERAARVLASSVNMWRGHGASDDEMLAAGSRGVAVALAEYKRGVEGMVFELLVTHAVTAEIMKVLQPPPPLDIPLRGGNFDKQVRARTARIARNLAPVRERYELELEASAAGLSAYALAVFDLYDEKFGPIHVKLEELLEGDETARRILPRDVEIDFSVLALKLPADGERRWSIVLEFEDTDAVAHVELDGWMIQGIAWTH